MNWLMVVVALLLPATESELPRSIPEGSGVYCLLDGNWIALNPAKIVEVKARGLDSFVETGGYTNLGMKGVLQGAKASLRISQTRPTIIVRNIGSWKEAVFIRLKRQKDRRIFETASAEASVENKRGFKKKDMVRTEITVYSDSLFSLTPREPLKNGEYLLVLADVNAAFDFGIDSKKQP